MVPCAIGTSDVRFETGKVDCFVGERTLCRAGEMVGISEGRVSRSSSCEPSLGLSWARRMAVGGCVRRVWTKLGPLRVELLNEPECSCKPVFSSQRSPSMASCIALVANSGAAASSSSSPSHSLTRRPVGPDRHAAGSAKLRSIADSEDEIEDDDEEREAGLGAVWDRERTELAGETEADGEEGRRGRMAAEDIW